MAKQNFRQQLSTVLATRPDATRNHEGGLAFTMDPRTRLYTRMCASFMGEDKFYASAKQSDAELISDVQTAAAVDAEFVLRLAAYARQVMNIRSTPVALLATAASIPACKPFVRTWTPQIVRRADEPGEVIAYWIKMHGAIGSTGPTGADHAFPNALKKGLGDALGHFGEYAFAKYDRDGAVKLRDVLRIVHPSPNGDARSALYRYLVKGELDRELLPMLAAKHDLVRKTEFDAEAIRLAAASHATWEVLTSVFGSKTEVWNAAEFPFMAGMRNLANLMRNGADEALDRVIGMLRSPEHVRRSKQLPFRFFSACQTLENGSSYDEESDEQERAMPVANHPRLTEVLEALHEALKLSVVNLPRLPGKTLITSDNSGSMEDTLSGRSVVRRCDVANLLASIAHTMCDQSICSVFGAEHQVVPILSSDSILTNMQRLKNTDVGHSTNAYLSVRYLRENKIRVDRIILFSDMQCYCTNMYSSGSLAEELAKYRSSVNPQVYVYSVDLAGYGTSQFHSDDPRVALLSGWSERLLEYIPLFETDGIQAVDRIARWEPRSGSVAEEAA
ncbi:MAG: TROVE domain-containing protein [Patescibacteria group bacterium]